MTKRLYIEPPLLLRWQPTELSTDVLYLDLEPDFLNDSTIRMELNVVFWPIAFNYGVLRKREFYVGSTGARIIFRTNKGKVTKHMRGVPLKVDYENSYTRSRNATVQISPKIETPEAVKLEAGDVTFERGAERTFTAKFSGLERELADTHLGWGVKWDLKLPAGQLIRDYLDGNLYLYVEFSWDRDHRDGSIELSASDILFFDADRRVVSNPAKLLFMRYIVHSRKGMNFRQTLRVNVKEIE